MGKVTLFAMVLLMTSTVLVQARSYGDDRNSDYKQYLPNYRQEVGFTFVILKLLYCHTRGSYK